MKEIEEIWQEKAFRISDQFKVAIRWINDSEVIFLDDLLKIKKEIKKAEKAFLKLNKEVEEYHK